MSYMGPVHVPRDISFYLHLKNQDIDFFGQFNYGTATITFREITRHLWTFYPFIVTTRHKQASIDIVRHLLSCIGMNKDF